MIMRERTIEVVEKELAEARKVLEHLECMDWIPLAEADVEDLEEELAELKRRG